MLVIIYLLEDEQELSLGMLIRPKRIYNFCLLHACFVWLCHVLVELYYTFETIWTNLLTQCTQLPASGFLLFLFFSFSGCLKCPKSSAKIILKISGREASEITKGESRDHSQGARRVPGAAPTLGRVGHPPGCPGWPLDAPLRLYNLLGVETPKRELFFAETSLFCRHRRFQIG